MADTRDELIRKAVALGDERRFVESLACLEECLRANPGWPPARSMRAANLIELGRHREALPEIHEMLAAHPDLKPLLLEMKAACDAALPARTPETEARRLAGALGEKYKGRFEVRETPAEKVLWVDLLHGTTLQGRVKITWESGALSAAATSEIDPASVKDFDRFFGFLGMVGAIAAFGFWVWFAIKDWSRIWSRLSFANTPDRASKLEVAWMLVGWAMGPFFAIFVAGVIGDWCNDRVRRFREGRLAAFAKAELQAAVDSELRRLKAV